MQKAIIIHGICDEEKFFRMDLPSSSNAAWLPWLQKKFLCENILCQTPEMPKPYNPSYEEWKNCFEQFNLNGDTIIVGHSAGSGFMLKWLSENPTIKIKKLILVAPYLDPEKEQGDFLQNFSFDKSLKNRIDEIHLLHSEDDFDAIQISVKKILETYPKFKTHFFKDRGHFCDDDIDSDTFPELWEICKP